MPNYILSASQLNIICDLPIANCPWHLPEVRACLELSRAIGCRINETYTETRWIRTVDDTYILHSSKESNSRSFAGNMLPAAWKNYRSETGRLTSFVNYRKIQYYLSTVIGIYFISTGEKSTLTHIYRHRYVQHLKAEGYTLSQVQSIIGHKKESSTDRYYNAITKSSIFIE